MWACAFFHAYVMCFSAYFDVCDEVYGWSSVESIDAMIRILGADPARIPQLEWSATVEVR